MDYLDIDRITRPQSLLGPFTLLDVRVEGEKRVELEVPAGHRAFLYVLSGYGRLEGDDTAIAGDDVVWFKPARAGAPQLIGLEADVALRALLFAGPTNEQLVVAQGPLAMRTLEELRQASAHNRPGGPAEPPSTAA